MSGLAMRWMAGALGALVLMAAPACAEERLSVFLEPAPSAVSAKPLEQGSKPRSVSLARLGDSMKHGQYWAAVLWGKDCAVDNVTPWDSTKDGFAKDAVAERTFRDELTKLAFKVAGDPNNLFKDQEDDGAELQVGALVTDVSLWACGGLTFRERKLELDQANAIGAVQMSVEWQIYSPVESRVIAKVPTIVRQEYRDP
jgi:hypothetical protein